jgi:hypothetical protein
MAATDAEVLRERLGESIPSGGSDADTGFTDQQITDLLARNSTLNKAVEEGWQIKAAKYADLVDTAEGTTKRDFSDLHQNALRMAASYGDSGGGATARTRVHKIKRS